MAVTLTQEDIKAIAEQVTINLASGGVLGQILEAVTQPETPVGIAAAAARIYGSDNRANQQKLFRKVNDNTLREGIEWADYSSPDSKVRKLKFYVDKCIERLNTPKYQR